MELGLTFPLQRFLRMKPPMYGVESDRRFCWDLHVIRLRGRDSLLAVHCHSRYTFVLFNVSDPEWKHLQEAFLYGLRRSLPAAGESEAAVEQYLMLAGEMQFTRTHGRREVAFLNRAWDDVLALDYCLDESAREQRLLDHAVNLKPSRCVCFDGLGPAAERMSAALTATY